MLFFALNLRALCVAKTLLNQRADFLICLFSEQWFRVSAQQSIVQLAIRTDGWAQRIE
jgi:hypothetical protein